MPGTMGGSYPGTFSFYRGGQGYDGLDSINNVWAVMDGDVASLLNPVPVPPTVLLLASGLVGLAGLRKKFRKNMH